MFSTIRPQTNYGTFSEYPERPSVTRLKESEHLSLINSQELERLSHAKSEHINYPYVEVHAQRMGTGRLNVIKAIKVVLFSSEDGARKELSNIKEAGDADTHVDFSEIPFDTIKDDFRKNSENYKIRYVSI